MTEEVMIAGALREELEIPPRVNFDQIAKALRLSIVEVDAVSFEGALLRSSRNASGRILVRRCIREEGRKRFTIAHEIGHYLLHGVQQNPCTSRVIESWGPNVVSSEREADSFASELLLPTPEVAQLINKRWPSMQMIKDISEQFGSSMTAAARKFCDLAPQACAVVWSSQRRIRWFHPSQSFVNFVDVNNTVGFDSFANRGYDGRDIPDEMADVPAEAWIKSSWLRDDAVLSEQSLWMPYYEGCLSLIWVRHQIEDRPTEEDELLPERDPEEFTLQRKRWPK